MIDVRVVIRRLLVLVLAILLAGMAWFAQHARQDGHESAAALGVWESPAQCRPCHAVAWKEWEESWHSRGWSSVSVQAAFRHFGFDRKCESCHAARPLLIGGLHEAPELRTEDRESGVNCLTCHLRADGQSVAAARTVADAPCRPVQTSELAGAMCGVCHTAIHGDWLQSDYAAEGKLCRDCHMPTVNGARSHLCLGGHQDATVRSGVRLACGQQDQELVVSVTNHATGHNFPGERHNRMLLIQVIQRDAAGRITLARQELIKGVTPFRGETSTEKIRAKETVAFRFPVVNPPCTAEVKLLYKSFPWIADDEALVVHEQKCTLSSPTTRTKP